LPLRDYCAGLLTAEGRKSVEPMAAVTAPAQVSVQHQKLLHFVGEGKWSDDSVLAKVRELVIPAIERHGPIKAWIIDDTSYPKQGTHSVGVHHQYCGQLGKQANCQVAVTLSIANHHASLPIAYRLYLPKDWADDAGRRNKAHVPEAIRFKTKPQIALAQLRAALAACVAPGVVLMDPRHIAASRLHGEGYRKLWARLRFAGVRASPRRVRRVMRENGLLAPHRAGRAEAKPHDGTIITDKINEMWGTDMTQTVTVEEGRAYVFVAAEHANSEAVGIHASRSANRFEAQP
jgi:hypothetical protein